jgi:hypothetical protein
MTEALPLAEVVHAIAGRARLRIADRCGDQAFLAAIATSLSAMPGVHRVDVRPLTGSVLIRHSGPLARIAAAAKAARLFTLTDQPTAPPPPTIAFDPKMIVGGGLGLAALWQLARGRVLPPALTLAWYSAALTGLISVARAAEVDE